MSSSDDSSEDEIAKRATAMISSVVVDASSFSPLPASSAPASAAEPATGLVQLSRPPGPASVRARGKAARKTRFDASEEQTEGQTQRQIGADGSESGPTAGTHERRQAQLGNLRQQRWCIKPSEPHAVTRAAAYPVAAEEMGTRDLKLDTVQVLRALDQCMQVRVEQALVPSVWDDEALAASHAAFVAARSAHGPRLLARSLQPASSDATMFVGDGLASM